MRLPEALKACLTEAAKAAGRSMNAEIRLRLEWSLERAPELSGVTDLNGGFEKRLAAVEAWVRLRDHAFVAAKDDDDKSVAETLIAKALNR